MCAGPPDGPTPQDVFPDWTQARLFRTMQQLCVVSRPSDVEREACSGSLRCACDPLGHVDCSAALVNEEIINFWNPNRVEHIATACEAQCICEADQKRETPRRSRPKLGWYQQLQDLTRNFGAAASSSRVSKKKTETEIWTEMASIGGRDAMCASPCSSFWDCGSARLLGGCQRVACLASSDMQTSALGIRMGFCGFPSAQRMPLDGSFDSGLDLRKRDEERPCHCNSTYVSSACCWEETGFVRE